MAASTANFPPHRPRIGLALGAGAARGWAHIGVLDGLISAGIRPDVVAGCSIGALVGGAYVNGRLEALRDWVTGLSRWDVVRYFELNWSSSGWVNCDKLRADLVRHVVDEDQTIEGLPIRFATVATNLATGQEVWVDRGGVLEAIWASIALPGLFPPVPDAAHWLVDGGLVNPVPVSVCRMLRADVVVAVNLNRGVLGARRGSPWTPPDLPDEVTTEEHEKPEPAGEGPMAFLGEVSSVLRDRAALLWPGGRSAGGAVAPGTLDILATSLDIMQDRIVRSRMAGEPPDLLLAPRLWDIGILEFHRASEAIEVGRRAVDEALPRILDELDRWGIPLERPA